MHNFASIRKNCMKYKGGWVQFQTPWGMHQGIVERVSGQGMLVRVPRQFAPALASLHIESNPNTGSQLDIAHAGWGYPGKGFAGKGFYPGGGWWAGSWWVWWVAFAAIFALSFLFW